MRNAFIKVAFIFICNITFGASVDTAVIYSHSMHKEIKCVIIKPDIYNKEQLHFPAVYLLHGFSDRYDTWVKKVPAIKAYADRMQLIIVCPDGGYSSWYFDSPVDTTYKYETHVSREVVNYIDAHYRTVPDRNHRAITGHSMGGYGSLSLALKHPDIFGAAGSMSGGVDFRAFPNEWDIARRIGDAHTCKKTWKDMSIINMIGHNPTQSIALMIECGTGDFFYRVNQQLHLKMLELKIPHDYVERPGRHSWEYWENAIEYQLLFFNKHFRTLDN